MNNLPKKGGALSGLHFSFYLALSFTTFYRKTSQTLFLSQFAGLSTPCNSSCPGLQWPCFATSNDQSLVLIFFDPKRHSVTKVTHHLLFSWSSFFTWLLGCVLSCRSSYLPQAPRLLCTCLHLPEDYAWGSALPYSSRSGLSLSLGFKCCPSTDTPHPELQTQISRCSMDTFTWPDVPQVKLHLMTPYSACAPAFLVATDRTHSS